MKKKLLQFLETPKQLIGQVKFLKRPTDRLKKFSDWLFDLPPVYFYVGLASLGIFLFLMSSMGGEEDHHEPDSKFAVDLGRLDSEPQKLAVRPALIDELEESAGDNAKVISALNRTVKKIEKSIGQVLGKTSGAPEWVSSSFAGAGIDRAKFAPRYSDDQISVSRWKASPTAPVIRGDKSFTKFIDNVMASWAGTNDFRIDLKIYNTQVGPKRVVADLVAEAYGRADNKGIQSTSIWKTNWNRENGRLILENIQIVAQEEIAANIEGGQLMRDCTASILKRCDSLKNQLVYGLDQWSSRIPGIDIVGNQGVAVGDINGDGLDDLYICQPHGLPNLLLIQNPDGTVDNVAKQTKLDILDQSHAALMIDVDNDRDQDLIVSTDENLVLLSNYGDGKFQLEHKLPIGRNAHSISAADFDNDGDLDLFLCKYQDVNRQNDLLMFPVSLENADDGGRNILLRNNEGWNFEDVTESSGITDDNNFYSRAAVWVDYDFDGDSDLYITNEFAADQFYENQDGWFSDISSQLGLDVSARHRSVSVGEFNQDGRFDFFVATDVPLMALQTLKDQDGSANEFKSTLAGENQIWFTSEPGAKFRPFFLRAPIFSSESAFGSATADLNNDGLDDVVVTNGFMTRSSSEEVDQLFYKNAFKGSGAHQDDELIFELSRAAHDVSDLCRSGYSLSASQRNRCYLSIGKLGFANFSAISGIDLPDDARAVATTDWDNDGDLDLVMTCRNAPQFRIFCNQLESTNRFLHFDLIGTESNRDAIGARVELYLEGRSAPLVKVVQAGSGNLSQSTKRLMFGVGKTEKIKSVQVYWPSGTKQAFKEVTANTRYEILEGRPELAETINERFELAIQPRALDGVTSLPKVDGPAVFYPPSPLPVLQFQSAPGKWAKIRPTEERPMLAIFYGRNANSESCLSNVAASMNEESNFGKLDCIGVMVERSKKEESYKLAKHLSEKNEFPFPSGNAAPSTIDKIKLLAGEWFNTQRMPTTPFALLLNSDGEVCSYYESETIDISKIVADLKRVESSELAYRTAASPIGGNWIARYRTPKLNRIKTRLNEVGYSDDAELISEKSRPRHAYELCQKAIELQSQGNMNQATSFFEQALYLDPTCVPAYVGEGKLLRELAKMQKSDEEETRIVMQQHAATDFEYAIKLDPLNTEAIIGRANVAIDQNMVKEALVQLKEYLEVDPNRYEVHAIIGRLLFYQKEYREAARYFATAFENRPTLPHVAGDLGFLYLSAGEYEDAQKFLRLAHRLQPSDRNIVRLLAEAEFVTGRFDEAVKLFDKVAKAEPSRRRAKNVLAWLLATCPYEAHRNGKRAREIMDPMFELVGDNSPSTLEIYAACFAELGDFKKALEFQQQAITLITKDSTTESYSEDQKSGMRARFELYRRQRPYRMADLAKIPIGPPGRKQ